ncbi:MAG: hypothetical protein AB1397_08215 [bacterium]
MNKRLQLAEGFLKEGRLELERYEATRKETALKIIDNILSNGG